MKSLIKLIKYYPIVVNINFVFSAIGVLLFKFDYSLYVYTYFGQSFYLNTILLILSFSLRFCAWHRILIYSMSMCLFLETLNNYGIQINYYLYLTLLINIIGLLISALIYTRHGCYTKKTDKRIKASDK